MTKLDEIIERLDRLFEKETFVAGKAHPDKMVEWIRLYEGEFCIELYVSGGLGANADIYVDQTPRSHIYVRMLRWLLNELVGKPPPHPANR